MSEECVECASVGSEALRGGVGGKFACIEGGDMGGATDISGTTSISGAVSGAIALSVWVLSAIKLNVASPGIAQEEGEDEAERR